MKKSILFVLLVSQAILVTAACPTWPTAERFEIVDAREVKDKRTGLVWTRCSGGRQFDGEFCTGVFFGTTHEEALRFAASQSGWRLPNVKELASLIDRGCRGPSVDRAAGGFGVGHWTSTPVVSDPSKAYCVNFEAGTVSQCNRVEVHAVTLVRTSQ